MTARLTIIEVFADRRGSRPLGCASFHQFNGLGVELKERVKHVWLQLNPMITAISPCPQVDLVAVETGVEPVAEVGLCFHLLPLLSSPLRTANGVIYLLHYSAKSRMRPVLHLHPPIRLPSSLRAVPVLAHQTLQPHQAGVPDQVQADLALLEL
jgi:hypothetical protein